MNWQGLVMFTALLSIGVCGYWLYVTVPDYAIAMNTNDGWRITDIGWSLFIPGSLFLLPSLLLSALIALLLSAYVLRYAQDQDNKEKINDYKAHFSVLELRAQEAEARARAEYKTALNEAERTTARAYEEMQKAMQIETKSKKIIQQASEAVQAAKIEAQRSEKKKRNAMGAAQRIKRRHANTMVKP